MTFDWLYNIFNDKKHFTENELEIEKEFKRIKKAYPQYGLYSQDGVFYISKSHHHISPRPPHRTYVPKSSLIQAKKYFINYVNQSMKVPEIIKY